MQKYITIINSDIYLKILISVISLDVILGVLRAIRGKCINSTIGIDGIIRKVAMIVTIMICLFIDSLIDVNLIWFIPKKWREALHISKIGLGNLFCLLYIAFESLSVLKNMHKIKIPIFKGMKKTLEKLLTDLTSEVK